MHISSEHQKYILNEKKQKKRLIIIKLTIIILFLTIWELLINYKIINSFLYSSPILIIKSMINLIESNLLFTHIKTTMFELLLSFTIASILGIIIASIMWFNKTIANIFESFLVIINSLPKVALGPLFIIWIGANIKSIIFMSVTISLFSTTLSLYQSFISVDKNYIILLKTFRATKKEILTKVIFPANKSNIVSILKINMSMNFIGVIMGELLVSKNGLGYLITYGSQVFNINLVITSIFIIGILAASINLIINYFIKKL